jgi:hypothetical protein
MTAYGYVTVAQYYTGTPTIVIQDRHHHTKSSRIGYSSSLILRRFEDIFARDPREERAMLIDGLEKYRFGGRAT